MLLTGTPDPESRSQWYHQIALIPNNALRDKYKNFYEFAKENVNVRNKRVSKTTIKIDYGLCDFTDTTWAIIKRYIVRMRMEDKPINKYTEWIQYLDCNSTIAYMERIRAFKVIGEIGLVAKTKSAVLHSLRMLSGGSYKIDTQVVNERVLKTTGVEKPKSISNYYYFDSDKLRYVLQYKDADTRVGIYYYYKSEAHALRSLFKLSATENIEEFNEGKYNVVLLQYTSKCEGIKLKRLDKMIFFSIDFSATSHIQSRERGISFHDESVRDYQVIYLINRNSASIDGDVYKIVVEKRRDFESSAINI